MAKNRHHPRAARQRARFVRYLSFDIAANYTSSVRFLILCGAVESTRSSDATLNLMPAVPTRILRLICNRYTAILLAGIVIGALLIQRAHHHDRPDLGRLYMQSMEVEDQAPVVFIHGILGSRLRDRTSMTELWLGSLVQLLTIDHDRLALEIDPDSLLPVDDELEAFAIADNVAGQDFYGHILTTLREYGHYEAATIGEKKDHGKKYYYEFFYDWRRDNVDSARALADFIDQIREDFGDPNLKVDLVAHSMGG